MSELTPEEQQFFDTGELPESLRPTETPPADAPAITAPASGTPPAEPAPPADSTPPAAQPANQTPDLAPMQAVLAEQTRVLQELQQRMATAPAAPAAPPDPGPDPAQDPLGAMMHRINQVSASVAALQEQMAAREAHTTQQAQFNDFVTNIRAVRDDFAKTTPDFADAYAHLRTTRMQDLRDMGIPEANIPHILMRDEISLASSALQSGKNPAQVMYDMARRYGYAAKAPPPPPAPDAATRIANANKGQVLNGPNGGRPAPTADLTVEGLKAATDADLAALVQDDAQWAKIVGNRPHGTDIF